MKIGNFRLGLRTLKTAFAVMVIIVTFYFFNRPPFIAALAAVFALRETWETTLSFGKVRLISNAVGGALALLYFLIHQAANNAPWVSMVLLPLLVIVEIVLLDGFNYNTGVIGGLAALLMISLTISADETIFYVFERIMDTFIGVAVAILINRFGSPEKEND